MNQNIKLAILSVGDRCCDHFANLDSSLIAYGIHVNLWDRGYAMVGRRCLIYGASGEIRTPDLVVRSHAFENALQSINTGISLL